MEHTNRQANISKCLWDIDNAIIEDCLYTADQADAMEHTKRKITKDNVTIIDVIEELQEIPVLSAIIATIRFAWNAVCTLLGIVLSLCILWAAYSLVANSITSHADDRAILQQRAYDAKVQEMQDEIDALKAAQSE